MIRKSRISAIILSAMMAFTMASLPATVHAEASGSIFASGSGTQADPYVINTADQLSAFATSVDNAANYRDQYIKLGADIDLSGIDNWNPIGIEAKYNNDTNLNSCFWGDFDGDGHTISNMKISGTYSTAENNVGLFSILGNTARIHDLNMADVNINVAAEEGKTNVVIRAGSVAGITGRITTAYKKELNADKKTLRTAIINSCSADGKVTINGQGRNCFGGGIIGQIFTYGAILNSISYTDVETTTTGSYNAAYAAGIVGMTGNESMTFNNVAFGNAKAINETSTMNNGDAYAGGLIGLAGYMTANNYAVGNAEIVRKENNDTAGKNVGVLAGQAAGGMTGDFNYFNKDAELKITNADGTDAPAEDMQTRAWGASISGNLVVDAIAKSASEMKSVEFQNTLNENIDILNRTAKQNGESDTMKFRKWEINSKGQVVPTGEYVTTPSYSYTLDIGEGGSLNSYSPSKDTSGEAMKGETLRYLFDCAEGYVVKAVTITDKDGNVTKASETQDGPYTYYTVRMPDSDATIQAVFTNETYSITVNQPEAGGSVSCTSTISAEGQTVTFHADPDTYQDRYGVKAVHVVDADNNEIPAEKAEDGSYTFTMPKAAVTISADFVKLPPEEFGIEASDVGEEAGQWTSQELVENGQQIGTLWYKIGEAMSAEDAAKSEKNPVQMKLLYHISDGYESVPEPGSGDKEYTELTLKYPAAYIGGEDYSGDEKNAFVVFNEDYSLTYYKDQYSTATENQPGQGETKYAGSSPDFIHGQWTWWKNPREENLPNYITGYINVQTKDPEHHKSVTTSSKGVTQLNLTVSGFKNTKNAKIVVPFTENVTPVLTSIGIKAVNNTTGKTVTITPRTAITTIRTASSYDESTRIATIDLSALNTLTNNVTYTITVPVEASEKALQTARGKGSPSISLPIVTEPEGNEVGGARMQITYDLGTKDIPYYKSESANINVPNKGVTHLDVEHSWADELDHTGTVVTVGAFEKETEGVAAAATVELTSDNEWKGTITGIDPMKDYEVKVVSIKNADGLDITKACETTSATDGNITSGWKKEAIDDVLKTAAASAQGGFYFITYEQDGSQYVLGATGTATTRRQLLGESVTLGEDGLSSDAISLEQFADLDHAQWEIMDAGDGKVVMGNLGARGWFGTLENRNIFFYMDAKLGSSELPNVTPDDYLTLEKVDEETAYIAGQNEWGSPKSPWYFTAKSIAGQPTSYSKASGSKSDAVKVNFYALHITQASTLTTTLNASKVTVGTPENGSITASADTALPGDKITLTITPDTGYELDTLTVKDAEDQTVEVQDDNLFSMPAGEVKVEAVFKKTDYSITVKDSENGKVTTSDKAQIGDIVDLTITPDAGYELDTLIVKDAEEKDIEVKDNTFTMPAGNVTVEAGFKMTEYDIPPVEAENGEVKMTPEKPKMGDTVELSVTPEEGYELEKLNVKDSEGKEVEVKDNSFTMPAGNVTVEVSFREILRGDVNGDDLVDKEDLKVLASHVAKIHLITDERLLTHGDVNADGKIDARDLTALAGKVAVQ